MFLEQKKNCHQSALTVEVKFCRIVRTCTLYCYSNAVDCNAPDLSVPLLLSWKMVPWDGTTT